MEREYFPAEEWKCNNKGISVKDKRGLSELIKLKYSNINDIVVVKNGYVVYKEYFGDSILEKSCHVASVTKSFISALIGIAIDKGYIESVNQKVLDFFPEYIPKTDIETKEKITIENLLTMTTPFNYETEPFAFEDFSKKKDWAKYGLDLIGGEGKIGEFKYSTISTHILSVILTKATGKNALEFANEHLFKEIGMKELEGMEITSSNFFIKISSGRETGWLADMTGNSVGGFGLTLTADDMARFGYLYLNEGKWNGKQIISKEWIENSLTMNATDYGYLWWLFEEEDFIAYCALGDGGNVICCLPQKDIVITIASRFLPRPKDRIELITKYILPIIK